MCQQDYYSLATKENATESKMQNLNNFSYLFLQQCIQMSNDNLVQKFSHCTHTIIIIDRSVLLYFVRKTIVLCELNNFDKMIEMVFQTLGP